MVMDIHNCFSATHFGIALPKWIVERENSVWVLAVYGLVFMIILPVSVVSKPYIKCICSKFSMSMDGGDPIRYTLSTYIFNGPALTAQC